MNYNILVINPGSTSDDIGYYRGQKPVFEVTVRYSMTDLEPYEGKNVLEQLPLRKKLILDYLIDHNIPLEEINAVIGRGGFIKSVSGGVYEVNEQMLADLSSGRYGGIHPSNLGGILAQEIAKIAHCPSFIANKLGKQYTEINCIVCHGGGGITVGAHCKGRVIDVNNGYEGDGPMTPQRSGGVPSSGLVQMCFSGKYTERDIKLKLRGKGGLVAYTGTSDVKDLEEFIRTGVKRPGSMIFCTREQAEEARDAMVYQIAKYIGAMAVVLKGQVDFIALTGGLMHSKVIPQKIGEYVGWLAPLYVFPGSEEKIDLREAAQRALEDPSCVKRYV